MSELADTTVLLTGASGGIGSATAKLLLERGAQLIAHYGHDRAAAEQAVSRAPAERSTLIACDLAVPGSGRELWRMASARHPRIDVLVLNAAAMPRTPFDGEQGEWDAGWEQALRVNVLEPANLIRAAVAQFLAQGAGTIITLSSWTAQRGSAVPQLGAYAASKAAIHALTQTVARNHARNGILAYVIAPGIVDTPMSTIAATHRGGLAAVNAELAIGRMVEPREVAELIAFLAGTRCANLTGATLDVNGATYIR